MTVEEKKEKFIETWGSIGSKWGITKTMAHIHALLLVEDKPLCANEIMERLSISGGNVNMNLRSLLEWELARGVQIEGNRKEYFVAEKDMMTIFLNIVRKRKEQELRPLQLMLEELLNQEKDTESQDEALNKTLKDMKFFADRADTILSSLTKSDKSWMLRGFNVFNKKP